MLSLNEGTMEIYSQWQWSEDLADETSGTNLLIQPFVELITALLDGKGEDAIQSAAAPNRLPIS